MSLDFYILDPNDIDGHELYWRNITHNLNEMAAEAGMYEPGLWRPAYSYDTRAKELIPILEAGVAKMESDPEHFAKFNPPNGWGDYDALLDFARDVLAACRQYQDGIVYRST